MKIKGTIFPNKEINKFETSLSTGQYSYIDPNDPFYDKVYSLLKNLNPKFFRSHNNYNDDYLDSTEMDSFHIVEPYPPEHEQYKWDFSQLDKKIFDEFENCDRETFIYNLRTCPPWMLDKTKAAPLFPNTSGEVIDKTYQQLADFCARIVGWYNKGGFTDEKGIFHKSDYFLNIKQWEILNEQDEAESAIYIRTGKEYAKAYDAIVRAIKKVDPNVTCGGPSQSCVPTEKHDLTYVKEFLENVEEKVDFVTVHYYSDQSGLLTPEGVQRNKKNLNNESYERHFLESIDDIGNYFTELVGLVKKYGDIPIFISETNVCLDSGFDHPLALGEFSQGNFGTAWLGYLFKIASMAGVNLLQQYQFYCPLNRSQHLKNHLSMINNVNGEPQLTYWLIKALSEFFNAGGVIVENNFKGDIEVLAVKYPEINKVILMVINKSAQEKMEDRFSGKDIQIDINFKDYNINKDTIKMVILDRLNKEYKYVGDNEKNILDKDGLGFTIHGYGVALIEFYLDIKRAHNFLLGEEKE